MNIEITVVNGKQFVSGLRWHKLSKVRSYKKQAKEISTKEGWDMVTIRRTRTSIMAGYAPRGKKGLRGMYSLASALAAQLGENWVGIFTLEDGRYALAAVNGGEVMPGYDLVGDFAYINSCARECYSLASSNDASDAPRQIRTIAPKEFEFGDEHLELKDLLKPRYIRRDHQLRPVSFSFTTAEMLVFGGAGAALLFGAYLGNSWWEAKKRADEIELAKRTIAEQKAAVSTAVQAEVHPWEQLPRADQVIAACGEHLDTTSLSLGGWIFKEASCGPGSASATYDRNPAVADKDFIAAVTSATGAPPDIAQNTASVTYGRAMPAAGPEQLRPLGAVLMDVSARLVMFEGTTFQLTKDAESAVPAEGAPQASYVEAPFEITTPWPPADLLVGVDTAGIRITNIRTALDAEKGELAFTLKGNLYGTR